MEGVSDVDIPESDLEVTFTRSGGKTPDRGLTLGLAQAKLEPTLEPTLLRLRTRKRGAERE